MKTNKNVDEMLKTFSNRLIDTKDLDENEFGDYFGIDSEDINESVGKKKIVRTKKET